jgi:hypothetical protein
MKNFAQIPVRTADDVPSKKPCKASSEDMESGVSQPLGLLSENNRNRPEVEAGEDDGGRDFQLSAETRISSHCLLGACSFSLCWIIQTVLRVKD